MGASEGSVNELPERIEMWERLISECFPSCHELMSQDDVIRFIAEQIAYRRLVPLVRLLDSDTRAEVAE